MSVFRSSSSRSPSMIPFNVHYTGVKTKGTFNVQTKTFTAADSGGGS